MIVLSAGMQKAGSGWYFNMINDLLVAAGYQDIRALRDRYRLHPILKYYNCNVGRPILPKLALLLVPHLMGNTFVVKTHSGPTRSLRYLMSWNQARATYIYRDPRDAAISAYDHGQKLRQQGETHSFARLESGEDLLQAVEEWLAIWDEWMRCEGVLTTRYENLLAEPLNEMQRLADFLSIEVPGQELSRIVETYQAKRASREKDTHLGLAVHFHKGVAGRFREVLSEQELARYNERFAGHLSRMGYQE